MIWSRIYVKNKHEWILQFDYSLFDKFHHSQFHLFHIYICLYLYNIICFYCLFIVTEPIYLNSGSIYNKMIHKPKYISLACNVHALNACIVYKQYIKYRKSVYHIVIIFMLPIAVWHLHVYLFKIIAMAERESWCATTHYTVKHNERSDIPHDAFGHIDPSCSKENMKYLKTPRVFSNASNSHLFCLHAFILILRTSHPNTHNRRGKPVIHKLIMSRSCRLLRITRSALCAMC